MPIRWVASAHRKILLGWCFSLAAGRERTFREHTSRLTVSNGMRY